MIRFLILTITALFVINCKDNSGTTKYTVGQEWNYKTRKGEENSTLKILKIEEYPETGKVIHISVNRLRMKNPASPEGFSQTLSHIPISEEALNKSITKVQNETKKMPDSTEMDGYSYWKKEFDNGNAGVFSIPVSEIVKGMERSIVSGNYTK
ncbi:hypothetical protein [Chryseobacterium taiwanense]|uniref:Uncharacterized protein n=1 Tax=Chryseobacterium taiwanense TaxID=363331 RepID=A0A0B4E7G9_9FLAO|nr:hypothetical protein [Chryseobacterium taiwanense]KIC62578.1 hypothetical protein RM51_11995 [Chryseobacterium taiwanense]